MTSILEKDSGTFAGIKMPQDSSTFDLAKLVVPSGTTLVAVVNPNNPNGRTFDMTPLPELLLHYPETYSLVDEAFVGMAGQSVAAWVPRYRIIW